MTQLIPDATKKIYLSHDHIYISGNKIKRVKDTIKDILDLSELSQSGRTMFLKLDYRPHKIDYTEKYQLLLTYNEATLSRSMLLNNVNFN